MSKTRLETPRLLEKLKELRRGEAVQIAVDDYDWAAAIETIVESAGFAVEKREEGRGLHYMGSAVVAAPPGGHWSGVTLATPSPMALPVPTLKVSTSLRAFHMSLTLLAL